MNPTQEQLLDCAVAAARAGAGHAMANLDRRRETVRRDAHDVKLRLDLECQARIAAVIEAAFPEHALLGEEDESLGRTPQPESGGYRWVVDPIDGTVNFTHGLPLWCCSVAVRHGENVVAGAVYAPEMDELYAATALTPATCNGRVLRVSDVRSVAEAMIYTGLDKRASDDRPALSVFGKIALNVQKARVLGSAALDLCRVASGQGDGYYESGIYPWDIAAGGLIVCQAGGRAETLCRDENGSLRFLATNGLIHEDLRDMLRSTM